MERRNSYIKEMRMNRSSRKEKMSKERREKASKSKPRRQK